MGWNVPSCSHRRYRSSGSFAAPDGGPRNPPMSSLTYGWPMLPSSWVSWASSARVFQVLQVSPVNAIAER